MGFMNKTISKNLQLDISVSSEQNLHENQHQFNPLFCTHFFFSFSSFLNLNMDYQPMEKQEINNPAKQPFPGFK